MSDGGFSKARLARLTAGMQAHIDRGEITGVVTLLYRHGTVAHTDVLGFQDEERQAPMRRDTIFRLASMTKPIVSVATMMLLEEGKLHLHDPIERFLPEFANPRVLRDSSGPLDDTHPASRSVTIHDLMTHRAGILSRFTAQGPLAEASAGLNLPTGFLLQGANPDEWLKTLGTLPLVFEPGSQMLYGYTTDVLGFVVARASGMKLEDFLRTRLFEPLGMKDTAFWVPPEKMDRFPVAHAVNPANGRRVLFDHPKASRWATPPNVPSGAGGLVGTADDYLSFGSMLLNNGKAGNERILSRKTIELMTANCLTPEQRRMKFFGWDMWSARGFGLGLAVTDNLAAQGTLGSIGRYGWGGAFSTAWSNDPSEDMVMLMMPQILVGSATTPMEADFINLVYQAIDD
jgi:CubicO group peptidase (beta-lactamase class C family)